MDREAMMNLWDSIKSLFEKLNTDDGRLTRIEFLAVFIAFVLLAMSILDSFRNRSRNPTVKYLLLLLDAVAGSMVTYTVGVMQFSDFKNDLIQVWGVFLTILYDSSSGFSAYSLQEEDVYTRRRREVNDLMNTLFVANLNATHQTTFVVLLWVLWGANTLKLLHRILAMEFAARSYGLGWNSRLVADYMHYEHEHGEDVDPHTMRGYKYFVLGEDDQEVDVMDGQGYLLQLNVTRKDKLITLDKVWQCPGKLLNATTGVDKEGRLKDLCLSFSLYKLLRRRFDGENELAEAKLKKTKDLVLKGLLGESDYCKRTFRVIEVELAFMSDYLHTRHPLIFSCGLPLFNLGLFVIIAGASCWLGVILIWYYKPAEDAVFHKVKGMNIDVLVTLVVLLVIIAKETWEIVIYLFSIWAKVALICKYVRWPTCQTSFLADMLLGCLCKLTVMKHWHGKIHQYSLLKSYSYDPPCWKYCSKIWRLMTNRKQGGKGGIRPIKLPEQVKEAVLNSLRFVLVDDHINLTNGLRSLERNNMSRGLYWACQLETPTHTVLVWHIATSLCEIRLAQQYGDSYKSLSPIRHCLNTLKNRHKPPHYDVDLEKLEKGLQSNYIVATNLSRYCAYMLVSVPGLLPDRNFASDYILNKTVHQLRSYLHGCDNSSMQSIYEKMMVIGENDENDIIEKGARLGKQLIEATENEEECWKVLADFWSEMILFLAPSSDADEHALSLATGGELITLLWALLSHAGILEQPCSAPQPMQGLDAFATS